MKKKININFGNYLKLIKKRKAFICGIKGTRLNKNEIQFLKKFKPWGVILFSRNIKSTTQTYNLTKSIKLLFNDKYYPILIDEEGIPVSRIKDIYNNTFSPKNLGKIYQKDKKKFNIMCNKYIHDISKILRSLGINFNTVPVLDIYRPKKHKVIGDRAFSSNPKIVSKIGNIFIKKFLKKKIICITKHIPGHGLADVDSHFQLPIIKKNYNFLIKNDFFPFKGKSMTPSMTAHVLYYFIDKKFPATHSKKTINVIRKDIGFKNILISDDISMKSLKHSIANNSKLAFKSGCDLVLHCNGNLNEMKKVAENSPFLNDFIVKKTSQLKKKLS